MFYILKIVIVFFSLYFIGNWIFGDPDSDSGINYFKYENFRCKDQNITSHTPIAIYTFKNTGGAGKISDVNPYFGEILDSSSDAPCCIDSISVKKVYPVGSRFEIQKLFGSVNIFGEGHDSFLLHGNDGVYFWIPTSSINVKTCAFNYEYGYNYQELSSEKSVNFNVKKELVFSTTPKKYNPKQYYKLVLNMLNGNIQDTRNKTPTLYVYLPKLKKEKPSYLYKYIFNIVSKYLINTNKYIIKPIEVDNDVFALRYNSMYYKPYHCLGFLQDPYSCLKDLPRWLNKPYKTKSIIYDSILSKSLIEKSKDRYFMVLRSLKNEAFDHIVRVYSYEQKLKKNITNLKIYKADEKLSHFFHKDGFYIVDHNLTIKEYDPFYIDKFIRHSKLYFNTSNN